MARIFGWHFIDIEETRMNELFHPDDSDYIGKEIFTNTDRDYSFMTCKGRLKCKDGSFKTVELTGVNLTKDQYIGGILISLHDVTEYLKREGLSANTSEGSEEDRLKTAKYENIGHDLLTPLNGIISFAELLNDPNIKEEDRKEFTDIIKRSGSRMLEIINDLVKTSKVESGQREGSKYYPN